MSKIYELMLVIRPDVEVTDKTAPAMVANLVGDKVKVETISILGKKPLAYQIKKKNEGIYVLVSLSGKIIVPDIEKRVQLGTEVLRFLLTAKK